LESEPHCAHLICTPTFQCAASFLIELGNLGGAPRGHGSPTGLFIRPGPQFFYFLSVVSVPLEDLKKACPCFS
jgi:hypothetical protein